MPTLQHRDNPSSRVDTGDAVVDAAAKVDTRPIKKRLASFLASHKAYVAAEERVRTAETNLRKAQQVAGECDTDLDEAVDGVATAGAGDGLPRANPFKPLGLPSPSDIKDTPQAKEPKVVRDLVKAVRKRKGSSKALLAAAASAEKKAAASEAAQAKLPALEKALQTAITQRNVLAAPWEKDFAALKRATRAAEDEGATGLFEALFQRTAPAAAPRRPRTKAATKPVKTPAPSDSAPAPAPVDALAAGGKPRRSRRRR